MRYDYDVTVIGGGSAGLFAASAANTLGAKTCLIEKRKLGGDCTWFGCVPSKSLLKSAYVAHLIRRHAEFGIDIEGNLNINTDKVMSHVRAVIKDIYSHEEPEAFERRGIKVIIGAPRFINKNAVRVGDENIASKRFIVSTGSSPAIPPIKGLEDIDYLTNENVFELNALPRSLIVLGAGPIGIELSQALNRLGVKIYIVEMLDRILYREDKEAAEVVANRLKEEGVKIITGEKAVEFFKKDDSVFARLEDKRGGRREISADNVLVAVGRAPNLEGLSLEDAGVEYTRKGINVNSYLETTNKNIFACGDIAGPYMFTNVASYQAGVSIRNALFKRPAWQRVNYGNVAWATFTEPELAHLGLAEEEAREKYGNIKIYKNDYTASDRAVTDAEKEGFVKVITDRKGYILGAHIVGAKASEIIQGLLIAKSSGIPFSNIAPIFFIFPTLSEIVKKTAAKPLVEKLNNPLVKLIMKIMRRI